MMDFPVMLGWWVGSEEVHTETTDGDDGNSKQDVDNNDDLLDSQEAHSLAIDIVVTYTIAIVIPKPILVLGGLVLVLTGDTKQVDETDADGDTDNTNPYEGPVDKPVNVVDPAGNVIPIPEGGYITGSPDGEATQVRNPDGKQSGTRIDKPHNPNTHDDPRALQPHAHRPNITNPDGSPWLPIRRTFINISPRK